MRGWQTIGVGLSVLWVVSTCALCAVAVRQDLNNAEHTDSQYAQSICEIDKAATNLAEFSRSCAVEAKSAEEKGRRTYWSNVGSGYYVFVGLVALLPVIAAWALFYAIISVQKWVRLSPIRS